MSEQEQKKPKDIKDLKARLGRTLGPDPAQRAPVPGQGPGAPPPFAAPPFAQAAAAPPAPTDPFASPAAPTGQQEMRLVIDDRPIDEGETGRRKRGTLFIVAGLTAAVGAVLGFLAGNVNDRNKMFAVTVNDAQEISRDVSGATPKVEEAHKLVKRALAAASGGEPRVDFAAIEALRAIARPFRAAQFANRNYGAFSEPGVVDSIFTYYNKTNLAWDKFEMLANRFLPTAAREQLEASRTAAGGLAQAIQNPNAGFGLVPRDMEGNLRGSLVYVDATGQAADSTTVKVRASANGAAKELTLYSGQPLTETPEKYVILLDLRSSVGVLGQPATLFAEYRRLLMEGDALLKELGELQGSLARSLGDIAKLAQ